MKLSESRVVAATLSRRSIALWSASVLLVATSFAVASGLPPPLSIQSLSKLRGNGQLEQAGPSVGGASFSAYLVNYLSAGLTVRALVAVPNTERPPRGFPVIVANHGFHPNPPRYGITADGTNSRPGDYYRAIPEMYTSRGFVVIMPDYRGHNDSQGAAYTKGMLASAYYTEDVVALLRHLASVKEADLSNVFLWGHSMGGEVALRAAIAVPDIRAVALWSAVGGDLWDQAYYYSRYESLLTTDSSLHPKKVVDDLRADIAALRGRFDLQSTEPLQHLDRLRAPAIIQHALSDAGAKYEWSERLAKELTVRRKQYELHSYAGDAHLFTGRDLESAVNRDVAFFRANMSKAQ